MSATGQTPDLSADLDEVVVAPEGGGAPIGTGPRFRINGESARVLLPLFLAMVVIALYTNHYHPNYLSQTNLENILLQSSVLGIVAIGQTYLIAAGMLDLSVGSLASMTSVLAARQIAAGRSELFATVTVLVVGALAGLTWGLLVAYLRVPPFILTLGGLSVFASLALTWSQNSPIPVRQNFTWLKTGHLLGLRTPVTLMFIVLIVSMFVMRYTRFGRHVYALGSSEEAAYLAGLPTRRTKILVFVVSSTLVGFAGLILMSRIGAGDPHAGGGLELKAIAAVVLGGASLAGGRGSPFGTFVGVFLLGVVSTALVFNDVPGSYQDMVFGGVLIVAVVLTSISELRRERATGGGSPWTALVRRRPAPGSTAASAGSGGPAAPPSPHD